MNGAWRLLVGIAMSGVLVASCGGDDRSFRTGGEAGDQSRQTGGETGRPGSGGDSAEGGQARGGSARGGSAGEGGENSLALSVDTESLPGAGLNVPYEVRLAASGGSGEGYVFSADGEVPPGLSLADDGLLSGTPTATGVFAFTVMVTDSLGNEATRELELPVTRKRWLAYVSDEVTAQQDLLYVVDLESPLLPRTQISTGLATGENVESFAFSPDGQRLAYVIYRGAAGGHLRSLYIADLSGNEARAGVLLETEGDVYWPRTRAWALDSSELLFGVETSADSYELFSAGKGDFTSAQRVGDGWQADWISDTLALISATAGTGYARRTATGFSTPQLLSFGSELSVSTASPERAGFFDEVAPCTGSAYFVDFEAGDTIDFGAITSYSFSPNLGLVAIGRSSPSRVDVHELAGYDESAPVTSLEVSGACSLSWSARGDWAVHFGSDELFRATRFTADGVVSHHELTGLEVGIGGRAQLSADGTSIGIVQRHLYVSALDDAGPAEAIAVNDPTDQPSGYAFSPDSRSLYYYGAKEGSNVQGIYWVDLGATTPAPVKLYKPTNGNIQSAAWCTDSTAIAYRVAESPTFPSASPTNLYVSSVLDPLDGAGQRVNRQLFCSTIGGSNYCQRVREFAFQP